MLTAFCYRFELLLVWRYVIVVLILSFVLLLLLLCCPVLFAPMLKCITFLIRLIVRHASWSQLRLLSLSFFLCFAVKRELLLISCCYCCCCYVMLWLVGTYVEQSLSLSLSHATHWQCRCCCSTSCPSCCCCCCCRILSLLLLLLADPLRQRRRRRRRPVPLSPSRPAAHAPPTSFV